MVGLKLGLMGFFLLVCCGQMSRAEQPYMTVTEMIEYWGYPVEEHTVTTPDGYILTMHRIPHGRDEFGTKVGQGEKTPVYIGHCLTCSSGVFTWGPPEKSIAYLLADAGYDVWMGNQRGNTWSKNHTTLEPCKSCPEFWKFSWDDTALLDITSDIDYVLENTGFSQLFYVGYSMGTTKYCVLLSERPEYNDKIIAGFLMGPATSMTNAYFPLLVDLADEAENIQDSLHEQGIYEFLESSDALHYIAHEVCDDEHPLTEQACAFIFDDYLGIHPDQLNVSMISFYLDNVPAGTSSETFVHYTQLYVKGNDAFDRYDWGAEENLIRYGQIEAPAMDLSKITVPTALFVGDADSLATVADNEVLASQLPNLLGNHIVNYEGWTHCAFIMAIDADVLVYNQILDYMAQLAP